ncbi:MAG TPA: hypothetical protein VLU94_02245 [Candidatus Nitrosotalea sp.]|nr:hypothetical protein [Candidatus Nitrosotalea sp.]
MKKLIVRIVIVLVLLVIVAVGAGFFFLGSIIKKGVETVGPMVTKTDVKLDSANLLLLSGSGTLKGLVVGNPAGFKTESAIRVGSATVGVKPASIFSDKIHVTQVEVLAPEITFEAGLKGNNLSKLLDNVESASGGDSHGGSTAKGSGASRKIQVDNFLITGGKINLSVDMAMLGGKSGTVPLPEIHLTGLGEGPDGITVAELTKKVLNEVLKQAIPAAEKAVAKLGQNLGSALKEAGKDGGGDVGKAAKGIGDLFKKKQ